MFGLLIMLLQGKSVGLPCPTTNRDGVLHIDGLLVKNAYLVNGSASFLLASTAKNSQAPVGMDMLKELPSESSLHVEFCEDRAVRLVANGKEIYELTQKRTDENHENGIVMIERIMVFLFIAAIVGRYMVRWEEQNRN